MKDRIPLYPGRVKLVPVAGEENTYDLVRADQPTQAGTPLNKSSLLKDTTAALYGLDETAVPDEVLLKIALTGLDTSSYYWVKKNFKQGVTLGFDNSFVEMLKSNDPNAYPNGIVKPFEYTKYGNLLPMKLATGTYIGTGTYGVNDPTVLTFPFVPKLLLIQNVSVYNTTKYNGYYTANTPGEHVASLTLLYDMVRDSLNYTFHSSARRSIITQSSNLDCNFSVSEDGKTFKFWGVGSTNASIQLNNNGNKYYWLIMA